MISGETGRGLAFLGGSIGCGVVAGIGYGMFYASNIDRISNDSYYTPSTSGLPLMLVGALGGAAVGIWSIIDAVKVAKVNNMYFQDKVGNKVKLEVLPYVDYAHYGLSGQANPVGGLSLSIKF